MLLRRVLNVVLGVVAFCASLVCAPIAARADEAPDAAAGIFDGKVHYEITPYIWLPTINGKLKYDFSNLRDNPHFGNGNLSGTFDTLIGPNRYLSKINFALMANGAVRKGNSAIFSDLISVNVGNQASTLLNIPRPIMPADIPLAGSAQTHMSGTIWTIGGSGTIYHKERSSVDVLLGGRLVWLNASTDFQLNTPNNYFDKNGTLSKRVNLGAAIVGTYGTFALSKKVSIPFYFDAGTGDPNFTWQAIVGVKYGQASLSYRYLDFSNGGGSGLVEDLRLAGPQFGYTIRF